MFQVDIAPIFPLNYRALYGLWQICLEVLAEKYNSSYLGPKNDPPLLWKVVLFIRARSFRKSKHGTVRQEGTMLIAI